MLWGLRYRGLDRVVAADAVQPAKIFDLIQMNGVDLRTCRKNRPEGPG